MPKQKKRPYGRGRIYLRGTRWWVEFKGKRYPTGSEDETDAIEFLAKLRRQEARGELPGVAGYTIAEAVGEYLESRTFADGTKATYDSQWNLHLESFFGPIDVVALTTDRITDYRDYRRGQIVEQGNNAKDGNRKTLRKISETSVNRELALVRSALRYLHKRRPQAMPSVPFFPMASEKNNKRTGFVREEEFIERLCQELPPHLRMLAVCAFYGGGREGEWLGLIWPHVDLGRRMVYFPKTKNGDARSVPIFQGEMLDALTEAKLQRDTLWPDQQHVFLYQGEPLRTVNKAWDRACQRAGLPGLLFHDLRRSASKHMAANGVPKEVRMKLQGHNTDSMDRRYNIVDDVDIEIARDRIEKRPLLRRVK